MSNKIATVPKSIINGINTNYNKCKAAGLDFMKYAVKTGDYLIKAKAGLPYGEWENWVLRERETNSEFVFADVRQCQKYMKIAKNPHLSLVVLDESKPFNINDLSRALTHASDEDHDQASALEQADADKAEERAAVRAEKEQSSVLSQFDDQEDAIEAQQHYKDDVGSGCEPEEAARSVEESKKELSAGRSLVDDDNWNTPEAYIESVRKVLGDIDIDPASNDAAQQIVCAGEYFTKDNSGLADGVEWYGRAFMNPPYSDPLCGKFCDKMIAEYQAGRVTDAIVLINATTDTKYFHRLISASDVECITAGRIGFIKNGVKMKNNSKGQVFFYFGNNPDAFASEFLQHGLVYKGECY